MQSHEESSQTFEHPSPRPPILVSVMREIYLFEPMPRPLSTSTHSPSNRLLDSATLVCLPFCPLRPRCVFLCCVGLSMLKHTLKEAQVSCSCASAVDPPLLLGAKKKFFYVPSSSFLNYDFIQDSCQNSILPFRSCAQALESNAPTRTFHCREARFFCKLPFDDIHKSKLSWPRSRGSSKLRAPLYLDNVQQQEYSSRRTYFFLDMVTRCRNRRC
jgi:hypothetical protein